MHVAKPTIFLLVLQEVNQGKVKPYIAQESWSGYVPIVVIIQAQVDYIRTIESLQIGSKQNMVQYFFQGKIFENLT